MTGGLLGRVVREKRAVVLILAVALLANLAIAALVVYPMSASVQTGEQQAEIAAQALRAAQREFATANATMTGRTRATDDLRRFYTKLLPADLAGARRATYLKLTQLARDAELKAQRRLEEVHEPRQDEVDAGITLARLAISMVLKGEYESVRQFLRDIEAASEFIVIDNVALAEGAEPGSALVLTVELSTYYRMASHGN
ncbi:MAG: GspMb/PilO family protein [Acidobacteria bacterium]|nr:GspMb/PilO family protein [Acidobacteriota bacterium]